MHSFNCEQHVGGAEEAAEVLTEVSRSPTPRRECHLAGQCNICGSGLAAHDLQPITWTLTSILAGLHVRSRVCLSLSDCCIHWQISAMNVQGCMETSRGQHFTLVETEVIKFSIDVGGNHRCELTSILLMVHAVLNVHKPLCICIALGKRTYTLIIFCS
jgi:hypothetical protein